MKKCFYISPIGKDGSTVRLRADKILKFIVRPVCESLSYKPLRADEMTHSSIISYRIMEEIIESDLVIADLTGGNPNVFYELAVRHFFNKPTIHIIEDSERLPFDISHINTIHFNSADLESAEKAKISLTNFIKNAEASKEEQNPVSIALKNLGIKISHECDSGESLLERFSKLSEQLLEEMKYSKQERELLWGKLEDKSSHNSAVDSNELDISGLWEGRYGHVKLIQTGNSVTGRYQFNGNEWIGVIKGAIVLNRLVYEFEWVTDKSIYGVGFWDLSVNKMLGSWYYPNEAYPYEQLIMDPFLFDELSSKDLFSFEEREWLLKRKFQQGTGEEF